MTDQEILTRAIEKAIAGGWNPGKLAGRSTESIASDLIEYAYEFELIFNHEFAKALWGDKNPEGYMLHLAGETKATEYIDSSWHYHLQQMVIAEDPIKYLGENI